MKHARCTCYLFARDKVGPVHNFVRERELTGRSRKIGYSGTFKCCLGTIAVMGTARAEVAVTRRPC